MKLKFRYDTMKDVGSFLVALIFASLAVSECHELQPNMPFVLSTAAASIGLILSRGMDLKDRVQMRRVRYRSALGLTLTGMLTFVAVILAH